ncbi:Hypothetical protein ABZS17G119_03889 [Kosakonia cowanii]
MPQSCLQKQRSLPSLLRHRFAPVQRKQTSPQARLWQKCHKELFSYQFPFIE